MPSVIELFQRTLDSTRLLDEERDDLGQLVIGIRDKGARERVMERLIKDSELLSQLITLIKKKRRFIGEINEPGWDKVLEEQKKMLKSLSQSY